MLSKNVTAFMPRKKGNVHVALFLPEGLTGSSASAPSQRKLKMITLWCPHITHTS